LRPQPVAGLICPLKPIVYVNVIGISNSFQPHKNRTQTLARVINEICAMQPGDWRRPSTFFDAILAKPSDKLTKKFDNDNAVSSQALQDAVD